MISSSHTYCFILKVPAAVTVFVGVHCEGTQPFGKDLRFNIVQLPPESSKVRMSFVEGWLLINNGTAIVTGESFMVSTFSSANGLPR